MRASMHLTLPLLMAFLFGAGAGATSPAFAQNATAPSARSASSPSEPSSPQDTPSGQKPTQMSHKDWPRPVEDQELRGFLLFEQLEYRWNQGPNAFRWDGQGWVGGDYNRLWVKSEGDQRTSKDKGGEAEGQFLYSRLIAPFWDFQAGLRYDKLWGKGPDPSRLFGVIGFQGLAPYWFEVEPALFVSDRGDVSARLTATYDLLFTQRLILQPRLETEVAVQRVKRFGVGRGINDVDLGLRLRYEIKREFAPYVGISWNRKLSDTADLARRERERVGTFAVVLGVRLWF